MALDIFVSRRALRELERIAQWWAENRPLAPGAVSQDVETTLKLLAVQPEIGGRVKEARSKDVRKVHVDRIRYWIYYRVRASRLEVLSIWHSSRGSGPSV